jgi:integrase
MRHTFGSRLGENNTPFAVISTLMGHTDPKTTMLYVHPEFEDHIKAVTSI